MRLLHFCRAEAGGNQNSVPMFAAVKAQDLTAVLGADGGGSGGGAVTLVGGFVGEDRREEGFARRAEQQRET